MDEKARNQVKFCLAGTRAVTSDLLHELRQVTRPVLQLPNL